MEPDCAGPSQSLAASTKTGPKMQPNGNTDGKIAGMMPPAAVNRKSWTVDRAPRSCQTTRRHLTSAAKRLSLRIKDLNH
jgi:hypothetical protein